LEKDWGMPENFNIVPPLPTLSKEDEEELENGKRVHKQVIKFNLDREIDLLILSNVGWLVS